ncbi:MAG: L-lactate permease [Burkholderiales bacterium]|nr:L-lactate permease [Burkholderiales bacterium]
MWSQVYDPFNNVLLSTLAAAIPVVIMLAALAFFHIKAHIAALMGLVSALVVAVWGFTMPADAAVASALYGACYGLFPIGWIILNVIFLYQLTDRKGQFKVLRESIAGISGDRRLQLLLIAFSFGAFFEGAGGFGTPVAVTGAMLIGLGFAPLAASGLSLIANTAPVAYGALGTPIIALAAVTGLDMLELSGMVGRQLPIFSLIVPFWLVWAFCGWRRMVEIWPAVLVAGAAFAIPQYFISNFHGPWLVDVGAAIISMACLTLFLKVWHPKTIMTSASGKSDDEGNAEPLREKHNYTNAEVMRAWTPWLILSVIVLIWGIPEWKKFLDSVSMFQFEWSHLHKVVQKMPPVSAEAKVEEAIFKLNWLSATGTAIFIASIASAVLMGYKLREMLAVYWDTLKLLKYSLITIAAMLALGYSTRYSGVDSTLGLAFANTGVLYPFFGTLLGWLGVALTGSDTASNVLFGGLQKTSAEQLGLSPVLMAAANSSGGVMGKMIDAQSIVVASTATKWYGHEGDILRYVFFHSIALACLVGLLVSLQAYVYPFTLMVK